MDLVFRRRIGFGFGIFALVLVCLRLVGIAGVGIVVVVVVEVAEVRSGLASYGFISMQLLAFGITAPPPLR